MKFAIALILVAASVQANSSLHRYGWMPGTETIFHYESQALSGIPGINDKHYAGLKLSCEVRVQSFSDYSLRLQMKDIKFLTINGNVQFTENGRVVGHEGGVEGHIPEEFRLHLEKPFLAHLKSGVVENLFVDKQEPLSVTNIKKSLLSQLQLDVSGSQRSQLESNLVQHSIQAEEEAMANEHISYFSTMEESIHGKCLTKYTIHRLPEYRINELEESWSVEEKKLRNIEFEPFSVERLSNSGSYQAKSHCEGKKYFQITKTRDFDQCTTRPFFHKTTGAEINCDLGLSSCRNIMNSMSSSTVYVCGEISDFSIRKIMSESVIVNQALSESNKVTSQVNLELLKSKPITERLQVPTDLKEEKTLVYQFNAEQSSGSSHLSEEIVKDTEIIFGIRPLVPQPGLTETPKTLLPIKLHEQEIISKVYNQLSKMTTLVSESPESCSSKSDVTGTLVSIVEKMSHLSLASLKELEQKSRQGHEHMAQLFDEAITMVGTNPSTMLVIEKVKSGSLPKPVLNKMIKLTIRSIKYPTQELLRQLVQMCKSQTVMSSEELTSTCLVHLSNLFYHAYVNPSTMSSKYPVKVYGVFGTKNSPVLVDEYIPFLVEKLEHSGNSHSQLVRMSTISALGKLGHLKALKPLLKVVESKYFNTEDPMVRSLAVYSMKRIVKRNQPELKPIILSLINNPVENPDVRIAAISVLPWCQPTTSELQKIAVRSWMEPSKQVSSFFASTIKSLVGTVVPELKHLGTTVRPILALLKHENYGMQYSHNMHYSTFADYLLTVVSQKGSYVINKNNTIPSRISMKNEGYISLGAGTLRGPSFTAYTSGMDHLMDKYMYLFGKVTETSSMVREQLNKITESLEVQTRHHLSNSPKFFAQQSFLGMESSLYLDSEIIRESLQKVSSRVQQGHSGKFNIAGSFIPIESFILSSTETGFPFTLKYTTPMTYAVKGHFYSSPVEGSIIPEIKASITPILNAKVELTTGILCPFTSEVIGSGSLDSVHVSTPVEVRAKVSQGMLETTIKMPSESESMGSEMEVIHGYVMPFTFKQNLLSVQPIAKSSSTKKILSAPTKTFDTSFGGNWGLKGQMIANTDSYFTDFATVIDKVKQFAPLGLNSVFTMPLSRHFKSLAIKINPSQSMTKEITMRVKLTTKGFSMHPLSAGPINEQEISSLRFESIKKTLNKIGNGQATLFEVAFFTKGMRSGEQSTFAFIFGNNKESERMTTLSYAGYNHKLASSSEKIWGMHYESKAQYPTIKNRWNIDGLLEENKDVKYEGKIVYGKEFSEMKEIKLTSFLSQTESQKSSVRESTEYVLCKKQESIEKKLSPVCRDARIQASSLDKVNFKLEAPKSFYQNPLMVFATSLLSSKMLTRTTVRKMGGEFVENKPLLVEVTANRRVSFGKVFVLTPYGTELEINNLYPVGRFLLPVQMHNSPVFSLISHVTKYQIPATCAVQPRSIMTFDGQSYGYKINDCSHLLLKDRFGKLPVAVMARSMPQQQGLKIVKILSGINEIECVPQGSGSQKIILNGKSWTLQKNEQWTEKKEGRIVALFKRFEDNVYMVYIVDQMLTVWTDGQNVEVVAPQLLRGRAMGLCGDMNGEESADIPTPKMCIMKPKLAAISYIMNKVGSVAPQCSGIPSHLVSEYKRVSGKCVREHVIKTPVLALYNRIGSLVQPIVSAHVVNKMNNQICVSKHMIKVCHGTNNLGEIQGVVGKPRSMSPVSLEFVCVPRMTSYGESLMKRALSGEPLLNEIEHLPVSYSKTEYEPTLCSMESGRPTRSY